MASANIHDYIAPGRRAHLVGIGGVSMSPLAEVLHKAGMVITGSDMRNSATVEHLRALGIPVAIGHRGENVQGSAPPPSTTKTPKSPPPAPRASPSLSGPRPGEPS